MIKINKITVQYSAKEDRLCLAVQGANDESLVLWLTARLAVRVVDALVRGMDKIQISQIPEPQPAKEQTPDSGPSPAYRNQWPLAEKRKLKQKQQLVRQVQQLEQVAAVQAKKDSKAVQINSTDHQYLVRTIDIKFLGVRYALIFRWADSEGAKLVFTDIEMRQWLQIVYSQFVKAQWPLTVWPNWLTNQIPETEKVLPKRMLN